MDTKTPCDIWWEKRGTQSADKAFLFDWDKSLSRVFCVTFRKYVWSQEKGDHIMVDITNSAFSEELTKDMQFRWKCNNRRLYVEESKAMNAIQDAGLHPPPPPPRDARSDQARAFPTFALPSPTAGSANARPTASEPQAKRRAGGE